MDKQKQIEEMGGIIERSCCNSRALHRCNISCEICVAQDLYALGYRKIPEGAVVLTREEYSDYLVMKDAHQTAIERCEKLQADNERLYKNIGKFKDAVRKETAKKFAERVKEETDHGISALYDSTVDEICKEITEGDNG